MNTCEVLPDIDFANSCERFIVRYRKGQDEHREWDFIIEEMPVAVAFNGVAYTVLMCTPNDLEYFAIGFALLEGIIDHHRDIHDIEITKLENGIDLNVIVANRCLLRLKQKRRSLAGLTGCGICGEEKLDTVCRALLPVTSHAEFDLCHLEPALAQLLAKQQLNQLTGSAHAAVYLTSEGCIEAIFEDVGRHIALENSSQPSAGARYLNLK